MLWPTDFVGITKMRVSVGQLALIHLYSFEILRNIYRFQYLIISSLEYVTIFLLSIFLTSKLIV